MTRQTNYLLLIGIALSALFTACQTVERSTESVANDRLNEPKKVLVLCDVSRSIDTSILARTAVRNRFREMISQCQSILTAYPPNTVFSFYFISRNGNAAPFARMKSAPVTKLNGAAAMKKFKKCKAWLAKSITSASEHPESQSCIMTSIETAYHSLAGQSPNTGSPAELIIISDMIEVCWASPVDTLVMSTKGNRSLLSPRAVTKLAKYAPAIDFDKQNISVKILFNAGMIDINKVKQLETAWRGIFATYHYQAAAEPAYQLFRTNFVFERDNYYVKNNLNF